MTEKQARNLLPMTVIMRDGDNAKMGTVKILGVNKFLVDWACGHLEWIDYKNAKNVSMR